MTVLRVRAPASIANLGPGFDCAAVAVELWNELEVHAGCGIEIVGEDADRLPRDAGNVALRAFSLLAPPDGLQFSFLNRIPVGRGLGSSAAAVALGLVAGAPAAGLRVDQVSLLELGTRLEGHADNLAAALAGGVCLTWASDVEQRLCRIASALPLVPLAVVPSDRVDTDRARRALPRVVSHTDAAFTAGRAALLGAAVARGDGELLAAAFDDRLHEPYRAPLAPLLGALRAAPPEGAAAVTLAGSGPATVVWARPEAAATCRAALERRYPEARVLSLAVAREGARGSATAEEAPVARPTDLEVRQI